MKRSKKNNIKISIITPSLNSEKFIRETFESVANQDYGRVEHILVDGGSKDKTLSIARKFRNVKVYSVPKSTQTEAINFGLSKAKGEILTFLNSDDFLVKGALAGVACYFDKNKKVQWLSGRCKIIDDKGRDKRGAISLWKDLWQSFAKISGKAGQILPVINFLSQPAVFFRKEAFRKTGKFNEKYEYSMDYDYWIRLSKRYRLGIISDYLACFRVQKDSKSARFYKKQLDEAFEIAQKSGANPALLLLRKLHDMITLFSYKLIN